jgi:hypothetical protein
LNCKPKLIGPAIAHVGVERVIIVERADQVLGVDRAAEEFKAVIRVA